MFIKKLLHPVFNFLIYICDSKHQFYRFGDIEFKILNYKLKLYDLKFSLDFLHISFFCFTFVKSNKNALMAPIFNDMELKDRIKMVMESQHMTQQVFADFLQLSPATLSSIYTGRTRPGLNIVEAIKSKIPDISYDWLISGVGDMLISHPDSSIEGNSSPSERSQEMMINFDSSAPGVNYPPQNNAFATSYPQGVNNTHPEIVREEIKIVDKTPRKVTEIRVYYDDQTYETFVPAKNK